MLHGSASCWYLPLQPLVALAMFTMVPRMEVAVRMLLAYLLLKQSFLGDQEGTPPVTHCFPSVVIHNKYGGFSK